ncbi:MAG: PrsW family intramembrane metalloprotease [Saprospiraceae bacterium]|nr:PrsW family intramembrane metalloprotease [Saprospiraceae bacterium]
MIKIHCPKCNSKLELEDDSSGKQRFCSVCGQTLQIPIIEESQIISEYTDQQDSIQSLNESFQNIIEKSSKQAQTLLKDLQQIPLKQEIIPIDQTNIHLLLKDFIFWAVSFLGIIPLLIITVNHVSTQLTMFALFFAFVWGVIFKKFIIKDHTSNRLPIASLFFTGIIGIWLLLFVYRFLPNFYLDAADNPNLLISLIGYVLQVGICEELIKSIPIFVALRWFRKDLNELSLITIGVFSGLGFAAFENLHYGDNAIGNTYAKTLDYGVSGLVSGVQNAMVLVMLRSLSLVFCHAVFSGIVAYFISIANIRGTQQSALIFIGFATAAILHGVYDWLAGIQPTLAALLAGFSFALFYGYLMKLKNTNRAVG